MLLAVKNLSKYFGAQVCLQEIDFQIEEQDRIGLIGENGAGKTTLIQCLTGAYEPDEGEILYASGVVTGYLKQNEALDPTKTVYTEMERVFAPVLKAMQEMKLLEQQMAQTVNQPDLLERHAALTAVIDAADGYHMEPQIKKILSGMAFDESTYNKKISVLSGGEYTRLSLARLLLQKPDFLILDEPTNHLDFATLEWLEEYLKSYRGAVFVVSHDRYFLDAVCNRIFEIEDHRLTIFKGNYSAYLPQKEAITARLQKQHEADLQTAAKLQDYVARNLARASTTKMAQSRRKQLEKMEITKAPKTSVQNMKLAFTFDVEPYQAVLRAKKISSSPGRRVLFSNLDLEVLRGERLVIAGPNGAGKSTLLKVLSGKLPPQSGTVQLGAGVKPAFFEQQQNRGAGTVMSVLWEQYPKMTELEVRSHLARLSFKGEEVYKPCNTLSGGEMARLRFAEILLEKPNLLFLDEPTNHLDLYTREILTKALVEYAGTLILVTHDRYLMNELACPILKVDNANAVTYESYAQMMQQKQPAVSENVPVKEQSVKQAYGKEQRKKKAQLRELVKKLEEEMEEISQTIETLESQMNDPEILRDHIRLREICDLLDQARERQETVFSDWEKAVEEDF